jgi:hypothetical protein
MVKSQDLRKRHNAWAVVVSGLLSTVLRLMHFRC